MSPRTAGACFGIVAIGLAAIGLTTSTWFPFAGAVAAGALCGLALTEPGPR